MIHGELDLNAEASSSLEKLLPRLRTAFSEQIAADAQAWKVLTERLDAHFPALFRLYHHLYAERYDFFYHLEALLVELAKAAFSRPADLRALDLEREANPLWFQSNTMVGGVCYVDLFAGDLDGIRAKIPYLRAGPYLPAPYAALPHARRRKRRRVCSQQLPGSAPSLGQHGQIG